MKPCSSSSSISASLALPSPAQVLIDFAYIVHFLTRSLRSFLTEVEEILSALESAPGFSESHPFVQCCFLETISICFANLSPCAKDSCSSLKHKKSRSDSSPDCVEARLCFHLMPKLVSFVASHKAKCHAFSLLTRFAELRGRHPIITELLRILQQPHCLSAQKVLCGGLEWLSGSLEAANAEDDLPVHALIAFFRCCLASPNPSVKKSAISCFCVLQQRQKEPLLPKISQDLKPTLLFCIEKELQKTKCLCETSESSQLALNGVGVGAGTRASAVSSKRESAREEEQLPSLAALSSSQDSLEVKKSPLSSEDRADVSSLLTSELLQSMESSNTSVSRSFSFTT